MKEELQNEVMSQLSYFGCLILGVYSAKNYFFTTSNPKEGNGFFHRFLVSGTVTFLGALIGSSFYNLTYPQSVSEAPKFDDSGE